jgi:uncharacterized membrane protein
MSRCYFTALSPLLQCKLSTLEEQHVSLSAAAYIAVFNSASHNRSSPTDCACFLCLVSAILLQRKLSTLEEQHALLSAAHNTLAQAATPTNLACFLCSLLYFLLQRKLSTLEEQQASLSAAHKERGQALDATLAEAARLDSQVTKLLGSVEKLESR